ncbi:MAG: flippase-like domain-containing protein [Actinomycetota bacterium]|nr:flippase-like domain-containing protein [Actinomycetota bacterium]
MRAIAGWLGHRFKTVALVGTVIGIGLALWSQREALRAFDWDLDWAVLALACALFAVAPLVQAVSFWLVLRALGLPSRFSEAVVLWMRSFLLRYAPSGALALAIRVRSRNRLRAEKPEIYSSFAYEQVVALASGAVACMVGFAISGSWPPRLAVGVSAAAILLAVAVRPAFLGRWLQRRLAARGVVLSRLLRGRLLAAIVSVNVLSWLATGAAAWTLTRSLTDGPVPDLAWMVGAYSFAYLLGFLVPLLPGGLGLRDATLIGLLSGHFGLGVATAVVLTLRLASTIGELIAIGSVELAARIRRMASPGRPPAPPAPRRAP